jgi:hypothetical protein
MVHGAPSAIIMVSYVAGYNPGTPMNARNFASFDSTK